MSAENLPKKILVVDDDAAVGNVIKPPLAQYGINTLSATDLDTSLYLFNQNMFDVVVVEQEFGPLPGLVLIQKWRKHQDQNRAGVGVVLLSGNRNLGNSAAEAALLKELGGVELVFKPINPVQLLPILSRAFQTAKKNAYIKETREIVYKLAARPETMDKAIIMAKSKVNELGQQGMLMLLDLYGKANRHKEGLEIVDGLLSKDPNNLFLLNSKAKIFMAMGDFQKALGLLEQADKLAPQNVERIEDMANVYLQLQQPDASVKKMKELIDLNPEEPNMKFDMFGKLSDAGYDSHAQGLCKQTTAPMEVVRFYNNKGVALSKSGRTDGAIVEYERSLQFYPKFKENYRIYYNMALALIGKRNKESYQQALICIDRALELVPTFEKAIHTRETLLKVMEKKPPPAKTTDGKTSADAAKPEEPAVPKKTG